MPHPHIQRRRFLSQAAAAVSGSSLMLAGCEGSRQPDSVAADARTRQRPSRPVRMQLGSQRGPTTPEMLQFFKRHGVEHICGYPPAPGERGHWTVEQLEKTRELCERHGVRLEMVALPFLKSSHIDREQRGAIMLGDSPQRDRDIEDVQKMIAACARAGIAAVKYNMSLLGVLRTERTPGRGGSFYSTWRLADARPDPPLTRAGHVSDEIAWERMTYFLDRVVPVCEEYRVRMACHPHDPGVPPAGYQGIQRMLGTVEGLKKFVAIRESPYHGLNLCLGSVAEMLDDPKTQIHGVIRYFGERKKIFNVHFRNIRGRRDDFQEVYLDEGDMNMPQVARTLHDVDYEFMVMPDHVPSHADDPGGFQGFACAYGYIKALLQGLEATG